jgi:hypothetical protein
VSGQYGTRPGVGAWVPGIKAPARGWDGFRAAGPPAGVGVCVDYRQQGTCNIILLYYSIKIMIMIYYYTNIMMIIIIIIIVYIII